MDVTYSGATTAHVLRDKQFGAPAQVDALDGSEILVTVTIGGNDVGYIPLLTLACLPWPAEWVPVLGCRIRKLRDRAARDQALDDVAESLRQVGDTIRRRSPQARVLFVDYLTVLPPAGRSASPLSNADVRPRPPHRHHAGTADRRSRRRNRVRTRQSRRGEARAPRVVVGSVDDALSPAVAPPACADAPQRGRDAGGRRAGDGTGQRRPAIMGAMIELRGLTKTFGSTRAVDDLTCTIEPGVVTGFLGPNGAGKSTTMRMILGLDRPTAGTATIGGHRYHDLAHPTAHGRCAAGRASGAPQPDGAQPPALDGRPATGWRPGRRRTRCSRWWA